MTAIKLSEKFITDIVTSGLPVQETQMGVRVTYEKKSAFGGIWLKVELVSEKGEVMGSLGDHELREGCDITLLNLRGLFEINIAAS